MYAGENELTYADKKWSNNNQQVSCVLKSLPMHVRLLSIKLESTSKNISCKIFISVFTTIDIVSISSFLCRRLPVMSDRLFE